MRAGLARQNGGWMGRMIAVGGAGALLLGGTALAGPQGEMIAINIARFLPEGVNPGEVLPSLALSQPMPKTADLAEGFPAAPVFTKLPDGRWNARVEIGAGTSLYGTGEVSGPLLRNGRSVTLWNTDAFGYTVEANPSLYQSHPWVLAVRADGTAFGVLADTTWRTEINLDGAISFTSEGPAYPVIIIDRKGPLEVCAALASITGRMALPPKWALGYQQCRYSYNPESRVREIASEFRTRKIPCDVIWFDIDYMDGYRVFTFDKAQFPDPAKLNADLQGMGFKTVWMIDPGVKDEKGYAIADELRKLDLAVKTAKGEVFNGAVWPGQCIFPDYTNHEVRKWWAGLYKPFISLGIDGVWNDMNEPAVFAVASKTMPEDNQHRGGTWASNPGQPEVTLTPGPHARYHNVYGMLMAQATREGVMAVNPQKRPFVLTRAGYLGSHRYSATWTGDNSATWVDLEQSVPMVLNLGLSGQPFSGPDIGGFNGSHTGDTATKGRFFARWMGIGALFPFSRGHTAKGNDNKEPWAFDAATEKTCRQALERRYRLMPYFYTLFWGASKTGVPVVRPVFFADPKDPALRSEDDCFLIGSDVLVVPQLTPNLDRSPVEPAGVWREFGLVDGDTANEDLPKLKLRAGAILTLGPVMEHTDQKPLDPLTLLVALNDKGEASGTLYEDAGEGYGYEREEYLLTRLVAKQVGTAVNVRIENSSGKMARPSRTVVVRVLTDEGVFEASGKDGEAIKVQLGGK